MNLFRLISRLFKAVYNRLYIYIDASAYARSIGVKMTGKVFIYGATPGMFGTEPWLISMGHNVYITGGCQFVNHDGGVLVLRDKYPTLEITKPISIGNNVYIGMNSTILPGVNIGNDVIIGAGSIVTRDIPSNSVVAGVPAKIIKSLDDYLAKVSKESLGYGALSAQEKERALKSHFNVV